MNSKQKKGEKPKKQRTRPHALRQKPKTLRRYETLIITMTLSLRDFDDDSLELIPLSGFTQSVQTSHVTPLSSSSQPLSGAVYNVHATQVTSSAMSMKPRPSVSFMVPKSSSHSKTSTPVYQSWVERLPKTAQTDIVSSPERKHVNYSCSSLPKLQLKKFDGDPLQWPDCMGRRL